jgi:pimeloyl-ACP methyl ester carboxylesterase
MALASPLGLKVPEDPTTDLFTIAPAELGDYLTARPSLLTGLVPDSPTPDLLAEQYRELTSAVRLLWPGPYDRKLARWLHRIQLPTLLLWGTADRLIPVGQCAAWAKLIPCCSRAPGTCSSTIRPTRWRRWAASRWRPDRHRRTAGCPLS